MIEIRTSEYFDEWFEGLRDRQARFRIQTRIDRAELGNFGDCKTVSGVVTEMRIHYGSGYRLYFTRKSNILVILLAGGDKDSQKKDIAEAIRLAGQL